MWNLSTSLNYSSNLYATIESRVETPLRFVDGMPYRARYEADQGWDELFKVKAAKSQVRRGASAADEKRDHARPKSGEQSPEQHT